MSIELNSERASWRKKFEKLNRNYLGKYGGIRRQYFMLRDQNVQKLECEEEGNSELIEAETGLGK